MKSDQKNKDVKLSCRKGADIDGWLRSKGNIARILIDAAHGTAKNGITFIQDNDAELFLSYEEILKKSTERLGAMQHCGLKAGQYVLLILDDNVEFLITFWACLLGGIIPAPLAYPPSIKKKNASLEKMLSVWSILKKPVIISDFNMKQKENDIGEVFQTDELKVIDSASLKESARQGEISLAEPHTTAFIQFSSGSTNIPKGVVLTHDNLLVNIEGIIRGGGFTCNDSMLGWMPYHHDMGLIGFMLAPMSIGINLINITPFKFVKRPTLWLDTVTKHKATITGSPNFGYRLLLRKAKEENYKKWDLSSLRLLFNGAEPISVSLMHEFTNSLLPCRLSPTAMFPVYGMAEACLAVCFSPLGKPALHHCVSRKKLTGEAKAVKVPAGRRDALLLADEGYPVPGISVRIADEHGEVVQEGTVGEIQISGPNVTSGYINNPEATKSSFQDEWLKTGDMGFMQGGRLTVTGRIKDVIFVNGQNFFAHDIESKIEEVEGTESGRFAVCGWHDEAEGREKVGLFSSMRMGDKDAGSFYASIVEHVNQTIGIPIDYIISIPLIPKTTSGKIQRFRMVEGFKNGEFSAGTIDAARLALEHGIGSQRRKESKSDDGEGRITERITDIWAEVLGRPCGTIPPDAPFLSLGGTSIKAIQILSLMEEEFKIELTHDILISCHTVGEMGRYIERLKGCEDTDKETERHKEAEVQGYAEDEDIAIVAAVCRFPDADSPEAFWENVVEGRCSIREIPKDRWDIDAYYSPTPAEGRTNCRTGAFIANPYDFDCKFFNITDEEAAVMDPQQRIMLELFYELLERAGYTRQDVSGKRVGLFVGASTNSYYEYHLSTLSSKQLQGFESFSALSLQQQEAIMSEWKGTFGVTQTHPNLLVDNILNMISARTSQEFNLKGPSMVVDTACSSSLVTLHLACEALKRGECDMAAVGGISLLLTPTPYVYFSSAGALSASGRARVFDEEADGFVPGEGAGLVMIKTLSKAVADGDRIMAVIKGSMVNNDGHSIGVMSPNPDGQREVIERLYESRGIDPSEIQYVEAHGTGTKIGDPSEIRALSNAFAGWKPQGQSIAVGSVKANIGHLLSAAGIGSLIKIVMALLNKKLPPMVNTKTPNRIINFEKTPFYLVKEAKAWERDNGKARRAAINSFGFGGTNCHVVLEEYTGAAPSDVPCASELPAHVLCLSAASTSSLATKAENLLNFIKSSPACRLADICHTENISRTGMKYRCAITASSAGELLRRLEGVKAHEAAPAQKHKTVFMFTGQGSQYVGMARSLYLSIPSFRHIVDECGEAFRPYMDKEITQLIYGEDASEEALCKTDITQPIIFTIDYSVGKYLMSIGIQPDFMLGHSIGEWAAACLAGAVSLKDAARAVSARGRLMSQLHSAGAMAAVFAPSAAVEAAAKGIADGLCIAGYNISHQVVSGSSERVEELIAILNNRGVGYKRLNVSHAFHSPLMEPMLEAFENELKDIRFSVPHIPVVSNVTGTVMEEAPDCGYWMRHITSSVEFEQSICQLKEKGADVFIEAGPDRTLTGMVNAAPFGRDITAISLIDRKRASLEAFMDSLGRMHTSGLKINWREFEKDFAHKIIDLPVYPFDRKTLKPDFGDRRGRQEHVEWFYEWVWSAESNAAKNTVPQGAVLVFNDGKAGTGLNNFFERQVNPVYFISSGDKFSFDGENAFKIESGSFEDYKRVFDNIPQKASVIIHLWNYTDKRDCEDLSCGDIPAAAMSVINISKAAVDRGLKDISMMIVTDNLFSPKGESMHGNPFQAIGSVFGQAAAEENSGIAAVVIDVDMSEYNTDLQLSELLFTQAGLEWNSEAVIAVRGGTRYLRGLERVRNMSGNGEITISDGDTYLITGGTSPVAGEIASALAKQARINLVLTGRGSLPDGEESGDSAVIRKRGVIAALQGMGASVSYITADVCDEAAMRRAVEQANREFGPIHGVIHAAGELDSSGFKLLHKGQEVLKRVMRPKVRGTIITDMVTRDQPLKFFAMLSSVSASKTAWCAGLGDYAAANAFLDSYACVRRDKKFPGHTVAINYSLWDEKGMGEHVGDISRIAVKAQGLKPLPPAGAAEAFLASISCERKNVIHVFDTMEADGHYKQAKEGGIPASNKAVQAARRFENPREAGRIVYEIIARSLDIPVERLDTSANFMEIGIDSIKATKVISSIGNALDMELYPTLIFEYQTPEALAEYIQEALLQSTFSQSALLQNTSLGEGRTQALSSVADDTSQSTCDGDIAIVGIGLRIPGADSLERYWDILVNGKCVIEDTPKERWDADEHFNDKGDSLFTTYVKRGGFIKKPFDFDPLFFGISPNEAGVIDPQQRIFLTAAWDAMQNAGCASRYRTSKIGVFAGSEQNTYMEHFSGYRAYMLIKKRLAQNSSFNMLSGEGQREVLKDVVNILSPGDLVADAVAGNGMNQIAARVSHCLNLTGPSLIVNSACSSSLVAVHMACESIRSGQCEMAVAGGVNLNLSPMPFVCLSRVTALSPSGNCFPFDRRADGMVLSEGAGAILLKPLKKAMEEGDNIYAVIKGSSVNNDGRSQGITAPRPQGQAEAITAAYRSCGINPETVSYIETHGTGTPLGDPIEIEGMTRAFNSFTDKKSFCGVGSVKSSIGHMLSAAGIISLIKVALALKNKTIPHTVNYLESNPNINFLNTPFYVVNNEPRKWESEAEHPLRAGVNAFGFGGTNAHVVLEEAPQRQQAGTAEDCGGPLPLFITARTDEVARHIAARLKEHVLSNEKISAREVCLSMYNSQKEMACKYMASVHSRQSLVDSLARIEKGYDLQGIIKGRSNPNKQTSLHIAADDSAVAGSEFEEALKSRFDIFRHSIEECRSICGTVIKTEDAGVEKRMGILSFHYAFGSLLKDMGLKPDSVTAGGVSAVAWAALKGVITVEQAAASIAGQDIDALSEESAPKVLEKYQIYTPHGVISEKEPGVSGILKNCAACTESVAERLKEFAGKKDTVVYIGNSHEAVNAFAAPQSKAALAWVDTSANAVDAVMQMLMTLCVSGAAVNVNKFFGAGRRIMPLPPYPFENGTYKAGFTDEFQCASDQIEIAPQNSEQTRHMGTRQGLKSINVIDELDSRKRKESLEALKRELGASPEDELCG
ncbi:acyl transferase domain-containing protein [Anaerobacterium chartisolvens]|uniref:Acyl transferase domain-containing protein n=1 Tax=Anaerobacterium chartisolvens TaxID=1297424 RepID=A0A369AKH6_9FIRM|nr:type I polyketide synthase [Anaerobacterium chartisolvens]RCX09585.1 acyl transferase domain-containing protein [Anaerobacterium chartisolvens]